MSVCWTLICLSLLLVLAVLVISYICFRMGFYSPPRVPRAEGDIGLPMGEIYEPYWASMQRWAAEANAMGPERVSITSFDGLTLRGKYYEYQPGAPMELMFHGYRGDSDRDLSGGVQRCFKLGRSALIVDQRASGTSDGNVSSFGGNEHKDCLRWIDFAIEKFGPDVKIILTGISMGAATVLMAGGKELPKNVIGILADCGYSTAREIIQKTIREMKLPPKLAYPFVKLGAKIFGHFDLEETDPMRAMESCTVPVIFFHGDDDDFVPCEMSKKVYEACKSRKQLVLVPGAGHGLSYPKAPEVYLKAAKEFFGPEGSCHPFE